MNILVNSFQTMGAVDGPGLRFVVFLQGCNLRCQYCHNPETWERIGGEAYTASRLLKEILRYRSYFSNGGGVTFSGGEPLLQEKALLPLFRQLKKEQIHIALDTSGSVLTEDTKKLLKETDLVLLDVKMTDNALYEKFTKMSYNRVLAFLDLVSELKKTLWIRQVVLMGINDDWEQLLRSKDLKKTYPTIEKIELLPFRKLCLEKYEKMNLFFPLIDHPETDPVQLKELEKELNL